MHRVTVIVPNYNHSLYLSLRLDSIFNQTFQDFNVIILDDCSTDNSKEIIELYRNHPKVSKIIYNEINEGTSYKQWYKGLENATGELIWIAESDDWCDNNFLERLVPYFEDYDVNIAFCGSNFAYSEAEPQKYVHDGSYKKYLGNDFIRNRMLTGNKLYNASMVLFRRSKYIQVKDTGFYKYNLSGDYFLWVQLLNNSKVVELYDKLNYFRQHRNNVTNRFRASGLDFIEGLDVLSLMLKICKNKFNRKQVYSSWINYYNLYKKMFNKGVKLKVLKKIFKSQPGLFIFLILKIAIHNR